MVAWNTKDVVISIGNQKIIGNECFVQSFEVSSCIDEPTRITLELVCLNENFFRELWTDDAISKQKIRKKLVEDCSIEELFFAIREKAKDGHNNKKPRNKKRN